MAQEILRICDPCMAEQGVRTEARPIVLDLGKGPLMVDLCELHEAQIVKPLLDAMALWGVAADVPAPKRRKGSGRSRSIVPVSDGLVALAQGHDSRPHSCPWCVYATASSSSFRRHIRTAHGVEQFSALVGNTCPVCGSEKPPRGVDSLAAHVLAAHNMPSVSAAVIMGRAEGDPFGVDARLQAAVR